ncbi:hypothetical protein KJ682_00865 [bacterium]|nr:hypothetical protein [bacterium]
MRTCILLILTMSMVQGGSALGSGGPPVDPDRIGIYFDEAADQFCSEDTAGFFNGYLVFTGLSSSAIRGWEAKITFAGGGALTAATPRGLFIDAATRANEYMVGLGQPLLADHGLVVVMDMTFYVFDVLDPFLAYVGPIYFHSTPELLPAYLDGEDVELVKPLIPSQGTILDPVLIVNGQCSGPVDAESESWGGVKGLFR